MFLHLDAACMFCYKMSCFGDGLNLSKIYKSKCFRETHWERSCILFILSILNHWPNLLVYTQLKSSEHSCWYSINWFSNVEDLQNMTFYTKSHIIQLDVEMSMNTTCYSKIFVLSIIQTSNFNILKSVVHINQCKENIVYFR